MKNGGNISTEGGGDLGQNPFGGLSMLGLPSAPAPTRLGIGPARQAESNRNRGRIEIRRMSGGRGGKTVTVASGFVGIGAAEKDALAKKIRQACGCGGTVKGGAIEVQGDQRKLVARMLAEAGFRPVMAGG
jgi:translation initiation factor 1